MTRFTVAHRRKWTGKTDYKKRMKFLMSDKPRLVIRRSLKNILLQVIEFGPVGDKVLIAASSAELKKTPLQNYLLAQVNLVFSTLPDEFSFFH